jgi:hypothetical protein
LRREYLRLIAALVDQQIRRAPDINLDGFLHPRSDCGPIFRCLGSLHVVPPSLSLTPD